MVPSTSKILWENAFRKGYSHKKRTMPILLHTLASAQGSSTELLPSGLDAGGGGGRGGGGTRVQNTARNSAEDRYRLFSQEKKKHRNLSHANTVISTTDHTQTVDGP